MNYRYEKIGRNTFLKVACSPSVANSLDNAAETVTEETPLVIPVLNFGAKSKKETSLVLSAMNFCGQADNAAKDDTDDTPLALPKMEF